MSWRHEKPKPGLSRRFRFLATSQRSWIWRHLDSNYFFSAYCFKTLNDRVVSGHRVKIHRVGVGSKILTQFRLCHSESAEFYTQYSQDCFFSICCWVDFMYIARALVGLAELAGYCLCWSLQIVCVVLFVLLLYGFSTFSVYCCCFGLVYAEFFCATYMLIVFRLLCIIGGARSRILGRNILSGPLSSPSLHHPSLQWFLLGQDSSL